MTLEMIDPSYAEFAKTLRETDTYFPPILIDKAWEAMSYWGEGNMTNSSGIHIRWVWKDGIQYVFIRKG